jgi:hypothetical protein
MEKIVITAWGLYFSSKQQRKGKKNLFVLSNEKVKRVGICYSRNVHMNNVIWHFIDTKHKTNKYCITFITSKCLDSFCALTRRMKLNCIKICLSNNKQSQ